MLGTSGELSKGKSLTARADVDQMALTALIGADAAASRQESANRAPRVTGLECLLLGPAATNHVCTYSSVHSDISYTQESLSESEAVDANSDGVPDYVKAWADLADSSWEYYQTVLEMTPTSSVITYAIQALPSGSGCMSTPDAIVRCGAHWSADGLSYIVPHEMFHQFQWPYLDQTLVSLPIFPGGVVTSILNINPWMESTANWATAHFNGESLDPLPLSRPEEVRFLGPDTSAGAPADFFNDVKSGLVAAYAGDNGTIGGRRAYGAMPIVEFFTQKLSVAFVELTFEAAGAAYLDGYSQINDALAAYGVPVDLTLNPLWLSMYTMCDPAEPVDGQWWRLDGNLVNGWCEAATPTVPVPPDTKRPAPFTIATGTVKTGSTSFPLTPGGAQFVDFSLPVGQYAGPTSLKLTFNLEVSVPDEVTVWAWKDTPGGVACGVEESIYPGPIQGGALTTVLSLTIPGDCGYATAMIVNHSGDELAGPDDEFGMSWSALESSAVISNGVVTLGVNADGSLGLPVPDDGIHCRTQVAPLVSSQELPPVGLFDVAGGYDAIRDDWAAGSCGQEDQGEGWSVREPNSISSWGTPAFESPVINRGEVVGFEHTASTATSTVNLGDYYQLKQHWAPSADPRVYQLSVTILPRQVAGAAPLMYRRVLPVQVNGYQLEDGLTEYGATLFRSSDGVSDATNNMFWVYPDEYGYIDDPTVGLPHYEWDTLTAEGWGEFATLGFAVDIPVAPYASGAGDPQFAVYYGFADDSVDANATLVALGATTRSVVTVPTTANGTHIVLAGYRQLN